MIMKLNIIMVYSLIMITSSTKIGLIVNPNDRLIVSIVEQALIDYKTIEPNEVSLVVMKDDYPCDQQFDLIFDYSINNNINLNNTQTKLVSINDQQISSSCSNNTLIVRSPNYILVRSVETLVNQYNLDNVYIFCDSKLELKVNQFELFDSTSVKLIWNQFDVNSDENLVNLLNNVKLSNFTNILVIGEPVSINKLLDIIQRFGLFRQPYTWFTLTKSLNKVKCTSCKHGQMINIEPTQSMLHEYSYKPNLTSLVEPENSIDVYFYYDLTRLILHSLDWHKQTVEQFIHFNGSTFINDSKSSFVNSIHSLIQSCNYMGRYGDWIMNNIEMDNQLEGNLRCNIMYQSLSMKLTKKTKLFNKYESKVIGYMDMSQSKGNVYFTSPILESKEPFLRVVTILQPPFVMKKLTNSSNNDAYYGFYIDIFNHLKNRYGFKFPVYQITEVPDGLYGIAQSDEDSPEITWTGAAQQFASNEADFGLIGMAVTSGRESIMDFTEPIFDMVGLSVMMKRPSAQDFTFVFINVLETDVWYSVFISYFVTSIIMSIFDFYNPKRRKLQAKAKDEKRMKPDERKNTVGKHFSKIRELKDHEDDNETIEESQHLDSEIIIDQETDNVDDNEKGCSTNDKRFNLKESFWFCLISLTPQGGGEAPSGLSGRLLAATWWLFGFILVASYTANLAAFLTVSRLDKNIDTFAQMSKQYKVRYTGIKDTFTDEYFRLLAENEDRYYEIWKALSLDDSISEYERSQFAVWDYPVSDRYTKVRAQMDEIPIPKSFESALRTVRSSESSKEGYALIGERLSMEWAESLYCDIRVLDSTWAHHPIAFPISFNDPFNLKPFLDESIKEMKRSGELDKLKLKYWGNHKSKLNCPEWRNPNGIDVKNIRGCFIILSVGLFFTAFVHAIENALIAFVAKRSLYPKSKARTSYSVTFLSWLIKPTESG
ncbi:uncharacterized protein LOC107371996 [Tetranychus urticae]|uniref:Ionotropic glutamate receptor C-terminal domain-containing protein n=1 Tax=Tetranychus urticae TaxID=32264 RepID=T1K0E6_TETUR|nr:uncharacterized protein LOC107371996 [Tetranychus urticae]